MLFISCFPFIWQYWSYNETVPFNEKLMAAAMQTVWLECQGTGIERAREFQKSGKNQVIVDFLPTKLNQIHQHNASKLCGNINCNVYSELSRANMWLMKRTGWMDPHNRILQKCPACIQGYTIYIFGRRQTFSSQINNLLLWHFYFFQL